ncbi:hypothetical protein [Streptomyces chartreusis]|uniref:hypothetical protein n=1 Tax=Streptomyces chartreusis TaxID=1969 RepID=UPI00340B33B4
MNEGPTLQPEAEDSKLVRSVWAESTIVPDARIGFFCAVRPARAQEVRSLTGDLEVLTTNDGLSLRWRDESAPTRSRPKAERTAHDLWTLLSARSDLLQGSPLDVTPTVAEVLVQPRGERWSEAQQTALLGSWSDALWDSGRLPGATVGDFKAEVRALYRELLPLWRRGTRRGRVLSLDADLGGVCLYDLIAADVDCLAHTTGGVFDDERLNTVQRGLAPAERQTVYAYATADGATWTEAATEAGSSDPDAFGERVRRKVKRLAAEQQRRTAQRQFPRPPAPSN